MQLVPIAIQLANLLASCFVHQHGVPRAFRGVRRGRCVAGYLSFQAIIMAVDLSKVEKVKV
jgi:hypothetical protein